MNNIKIIGRYGEIFVGETQEKELLYTLDGVSWFKDMDVLLRLAA